MHAPRERPRLCGVTACRWTVNWACPGASTPGRRGYAHDDGTPAFRRCCLLPSSLLPPPPSPAPPPPVFLQAFFGCERGTLEGDRVQLATSRTDSDEDTRWVVVKSRDVGEPAPRLCEAELQHRMVKSASAFASPQLGSCASSGPAWQFWGACTPRKKPAHWAYSHCLGYSSLATSKVADYTAFDHAGSTMVRRSCLGPWPVPCG